MKKILIIFALLSSFVPLPAQTRMKIILKDLSYKEYQINLIKDLSFANPSDECKLYAFCKDNYMYNFHIRNLDSIILRDSVDEKRVLSLREGGFWSFLTLENVDSMNFKYLAIAPQIEWEKTYGGSADDYMNHFQVTNDGGFAIIGTSSSKDGDVGKIDGMQIIWLVKTNSSGEIEWQRPIGGNNTAHSGILSLTKKGGMIAGGLTYIQKKGYDWTVREVDQNGNNLWNKIYGGSGNEEIVSCIQLEDGTNIVAGSTDSKDWGVHNNHRDNIWLCKLRSDGEIQQQLSLGGDGVESISSFIQTNDNGFMVAGRSFAINDRDSIIKDNHGRDDFYLAKLDSFLNLEWQKCYGGKEYDKSVKVLQLEDNGYLVAGNTSSKDGDVKELFGNGDGWLIRIDYSGNIITSKTIGGTGIDEIFDVKKCKDNGFIINGTTQSSEFDEFKHYGNIWITKVDSNLNVQWQKSYGNGNYYSSNSLELDSDGGFLVAGSSKYSSGDLAGNIYDSDSRNIWIFKLDSSGNIVWQKLLGGSGNEYPRKFLCIEPNKYLIGGTTSSIDGDVSFNHGLEDMWLVKLRKNQDTLIDDTLVVKLNNGNADKFNVNNIQKIIFDNISEVKEPKQENSAYNGKNYPNPFCQVTTICYETSEISKVIIKIYNNKGLIVRSFNCGTKFPGEHELKWDGTDNEAHPLANGIYYYQIKTDNEQITKKMIITR